MDYGAMQNIGAVDLKISGQAQGDVLYFNGVNWVKLAAGTTKQSLRTKGVAANPAWENVDNATDLSIASQTTGDVLYYNGASWVRLAPGASGTVLTSNGVGTAPSFQDAGGEGIGVGGIYIAIIATNPATTLGYGTWFAFGTGRTLVAIDGGDTDFNTVEETGGDKTHALSIAELAAHTHNIDTRAAGTSGTGTRISQSVTVEGFRSIATDSTGSGTAHNNLQPYIVVYMWKRTA